MKENLLYDQLLNFHIKLENIISTSRIDIRNEASFIFYVKNHKEDKSLIFPVLIYLCDRKYIFENILCKENSVNGKIARYVILQMDINKFEENLISISKRNFEEKHRKQKIKELIKKTYNKCNVFDEECVSSSINCFVYENIKTGIINKYQCFKQMKIGNSEYENYIRKTLRRILGYLDDTFIYDVEFVRDFYICLKKIIEYEFRMESLKVITEYICNYYLQNTEIETEYLGQLTLECPQIENN